ncbi:unnamed protein product [Allacma fusca]|uniref:Uncharacterized protein n=1 Tax=Allacma fusca TaxID=39272 RepID=A0A8J2JC86_9HEXA|nr:unnamed protein product [Allacma fusca]
MANKLIWALLLACIAYVHGQANQLAAQGALNAANSGAPVGQPQFSLQGGGSGNNGRNWNAAGNAGVGAKVWESPNGRHSVGAGVNAGQAFGRQQGQSYHSKPDVGVGAGYVYRSRYPTRQSHKISCNTIQSEHKFLLKSTNLLELFLLKKK